MRMQDHEISMILVSRQILSLLIGLIYNFFYEMYE